MYQRILVPTDGTPLSKKAVKSAIELAKTTGAELVALNVVPRYPVSYLEGAISTSPDQVARVEKQWSDKGHALAQSAQASAEAAGVKSKAIIAKSDLVAEAILAAAKKHKCDLVVMASHGRRGIKRLLLGSETQHVLTHGDVPVLVLR
ncbi:universal stress protein [Ramlibacter albus]|uniref:Universal stress protein n=1 Tax=Ramlibacter albus TaxID=2079448 RepID=A0A923S7B4_9BURK|nr:universal stress protein [Ramlibacter albus]MBC5766972.1 universal stress protein [Ramlibacter albus]